MSETAPTVETPKTADQVEIDRLEALVAKRKFERDQNELFGKYDPKEEGPANDGERTIRRSEDSHETYHAQRPSEGIIRDGNNFRQVGGAGNGDFAPAAGYEAQNGSTHDQPLEYYDKVNSIEDNVEYVAPNYENMTVPELALATAKANITGDKAEADDIRAVFEHLLMVAANDPSSESKTSDADYQKELERFDHLVELATKQQESKNPDAVAANKLIDKNERRAEAASKNEPFIEDEDEKPVGGEKPANETEGTKPEETDPNESPAKTPEKEHKVGDTAEYNGETVTLGQKLAGADKLVAYEVVKSDGSRTLVYEHELTFPEPAAEKESVGEKAKRFWKKGTSFIAEKFTMGYMGARWFVEDSIINRGIDPLTTSFEDAEKIKHRRRIALVAGTAAVLVALAISRDFHGFGSGGGGSHVANALPTDTPTPSPSASEVPTSNGGEFTLPQTPHAPELNPNDPAFTLTPVDQAPGGAPSADVLNPPSPDVLSTSDAGFGVSHGEGGYRLFEGLGLSDQQWNDHAHELMDKYPQNLYDMGSNEVGLRDVQLPDALRADIIKIKQG